MDEITKVLTNFFTIVSDPVRLQILMLLKDKDLSSKEIRKNIKISQSYTSQLLKQLAKEELIKFQKSTEGIKIYSAKYKDLYDLLDAVKNFIKEIEMGKYERLFKNDINRSDGFLKSSEE